MPTASKPYAELLSILHAELIATLKGLEFELSSSDIDWEKINSYGSDYDPDYTPEWSVETRLCRSALSQAEALAKALP